MKTVSLHETLRRRHAGGRNQVDAIQVIQKDHRSVDTLFRRFDREARDGDEDAQRATVREVVRALSVHAAIEEEFLYPALREAGVQVEVLDALEEHHAVKLLLSELDALAPGHPRYAAKVRLLAENVRRHVAEEERELLPRLRRSLDDGQRRELGETLDKARAAAPTRPHPTAPDEPPGVFLAGAMSAPIDRARDAWSGAMGAITATLNELGRTLRGWSSRAGRRGRAAADRAAGAALDAAGTAGERASAAVRRGRQAARDTRRAAKGTARKAQGTARKVQGTARRTQAAAARTAKRVSKGARAATRGYSGEATPTVH